MRLLWLCQCNIGNCFVNKRGRRGTRSGCLPGSRVVCGQGPRRVAFSRIAFNLAAYPHSTWTLRGPAMLMPSREATERLRLFDGVGQSKETHAQVIVLSILLSFPHPEIIGPRHR